MIKYGIKHISEGYLVNTQSGEPCYLNRPLSKIIDLAWLTSSHDEATRKLHELGTRLHDLTEVVF